MVGTLRTDGVGLAVEVVLVGAAATGAVLVEAVVGALDALVAETEAEVSETLVGACACGFAAEPEAVD